IVSTKSPRISWRADQPKTSTRVAWRGSSARRSLYRRGSEPPPFSSLVRRPARADGLLAKFSERRKGRCFAAHVGSVGYSAAGGHATRGVARNHGLQEILAQSEVRGDRRICAPHGARSTEGSVGTAVRVQRKI